MSQRATAGAAGQHRSAAAALPLRQLSSRRLPARVPAGSGRHRPPVPAAGCLPPRARAACRRRPAVGPRLRRPAACRASWGRRAVVRPGAALRSRAGLPVAVARPRWCRAFVLARPLCPCSRPARVPSAWAELAVPIPSPSLPGRSLSLHRAVSPLPSGACPRPLAGRRPAVPVVAVSAVPCRAGCRRPGLRGSRPGRPGRRWFGGRLPRRAPLRLPTPGPPSRRPLVAIWATGARRAVRVRRPSAPAAPVCRPGGRRRASAVDGSPPGRGDRP